MPWVKPPGQYFWVWVEPDQMPPPTPGVPPPEASNINPDYGENLRSPENAGIYRRGVIVDIQNEDRFSPVNGFAFNPLAQEYLSFDNLVLAVILSKLARPDPKLLAHLMEKYIGNVTDLLKTILNSGKTHPISALNASTAFAAVAHRFGIITDAGYLKIADQTRSIIDTLIELKFAGIALDGIETLAEAAPTLIQSAGGLKSLFQKPVPKSVPK